MYTIKFISQFPPPMHGLSKAVSTLYSSVLHKKFIFSKLNLTNNLDFVKNLLILLFSNDDLYYFTISQTVGGNIRDLVIIFILKIKRAKILLHLHGGYYRTLIDSKSCYIQKKINYFLINKVSGVIVLSESLKFNFTGMIDKENIYVVENCVDDCFLLSNELLEIKKKDIITSGILKILYLSNFIESKGYKDVLHIALHSKNKNLHFEYHFAGKFFSDLDRNYFFNFISENNLTNYVFYHGVVDGAKKACLLNDSHIFILLSRYPNEGQPISILESYANALAVISTYHAGIPDIVNVPDNGFLIENTNIDNVAIINYLLYLYNNRPALLSIAVMNHKKAVELFSEDRYISDMENVFLKYL
ncbi:glycosyltransferase family 4 protein [Arsenicibacter rosenii]|uniref:Glycosyl transferase family 1 domain-containing protein n=1 Tax=Arsenicibacter rosenii TaxID=1750698 RepID=A0A1S2VJ60_9BACT|nr:glycosyltransferase family 4 protein [Arsenicibacter rosenii]OIN58794.1 hypothetical protein BLX24_11195 [Arsenicibacter rosenii]